MAKVLIATVKPFSAEAVEEVKGVFKKAGYEVEVLSKYPDQSDLIGTVADADALIIRSDNVDKEVLEAAKNLKIVVRAGAGYDNVDLEAATEHGVVVMNTPGQNSNAVAELVLGMMVFMNRNRFTPAAGSELRGKKLGIHAYGAGEEGQPDYHSDRDYQIRWRHQQDAKARPNSSFTANVNTFPCTFQPMMRRKDPLILICST